MQTQTRFRMLSAMWLTAIGLLAACGGQTTPSAPATNAPAATPTSVATATPAATPTPSAKVIFSDDFSGATKYFNTNGQKGFGSATYDKGVYRVVAEKRNFLNYYGGSTLKQCSGDDCKFPDKPSTNLLNATIEVDVKKISGPNDGLFGVACRHAEIVSPGTFYGAFISGDGRHYSVSLTSDANSGVTYMLGGQDRGAPHVAIKQGDGAVNHLRVDCTDTRVVLSVNGQKLAEGAIGSGPFTLSTTASRGIALLALTTSAPRLEVEFDNLVVAEPPAQLTAETTQPGQLIFQDDFSTNDQTWLVSKTADWQVGYADGAYQISLVKSDQSRWVSPTRMLYQNSSAAVDVTLSAGPQRSFFGLTCRQQGEDYYDFLIGADGEYSIGAAVKGKFNDLVTWTPSNAIKKGLGQVNRVRTDCVGDTLTLYINDQKVNEVKDKSLTWGVVGLEAGSPKAEGGTLVKFDNLTVSRP